VRVALLLAVLSLAACKKHPDGESTCKQVGTRFHDIAAAQLAASKDVDDRTRAGVNGLLAPMRDSMIRACQQDHWSAEARACFATAGDQPQFYACEPKLSAEQRALLAKAAAGGK
jgi:hypothetical protein